jgi:hypothetical protein
MAEARAQGLEIEQGEKECERYTGDPPPRPWGRSDHEEKREYQRESDH